MRDVFRRPGVGLLFAGEVTSQLGDSLMLLALAIWVKSLTGSSGAAGAVMLTITAPTLLGPVLGWVPDRFRRRPYLIVVNLASAVALLPLLFVGSRADVWIVYVVGTLYGISTVLGGGAFSGLLKELVPDEELGAANGVLGTAQQAVRLVGPLAGAGIFVAVGGHLIAVLDAASFVVAAASLALIHVTEQLPERAAARWREEASAGIRFVIREVTLRRTTLAIAGMMLMLGAVESLGFSYVTQGLHRSPAFISLLVTAQGVGGLLGAVATSSLLRRIGEPKAIAAGLLCFGVCMALLVHPALVLGFVGMAFGGGAAALMIISYATLTQRRTPGELMGRVEAATNVLIVGAQSVSIAAGAIVVSLVDYRYAFAVMAVVLAALGIYLFAVRLPATAPEGATSAVERPSEEEPAESLSQAPAAGSQAPAAGSQVPLAFAASTGSNSDDATATAS